MLLSFIYHSLDLKYTFSDNYLSSVSQKIELILPIDSLARSEELFSIYLIYLLNKYDKPIKHGDVELIKIFNLDLTD